MDCKGDCFGWRRRAVWHWYYVYFCKLLILLKSIGFNGVTSYVCCTRVVEVLLFLGSKHVYGTHVIWCIIALMIASGSGRLDRPLTF